MRQLFVVDCGKLVGSISDGDIADRGYLLGQVTARELLELELRDRPQAQPTTAADVMSETSLAELAVAFTDDKIGALPVVDSERKLLGVVSYVDVLRRSQRKSRAGAVR